MPRGRALQRSSSLVAMPTMFGTTAKPGTRGRVGKIGEVGRSTTRHLLEGTLRSNKVSMRMAEFELLGASIRVMTLSTFTKAYTKSAI
jgi:hypothetical protein